VSASDVDLAPSDGPVVLAAGAVVWSPGSDGGLRVALVHRPRYDDWSLPKGKVGPGEHLLVAACREVLEETGHRVSLGRPLGTQRYPTTDRTGARRPKEVHYWLGRVEAQVQAPDNEVDELVWVEPAEVAARASYRRDVTLVRHALAGPVDTVPVVLLRHAHAQARDGWRGDDLDRPLSARGKAQAQALAGLLAAYGRLLPVASPAHRAVDTLAPYAQATGQEVSIDPRYDERHAADGDPAEALRAQLTRLTRGPGWHRGDGAPAGLVVCSHGPDLPVLADVLNARCEPGVEVPGQLGKGEMTVAHVDRASGRVVAVERHAV
jgi:8-oxo-dGTP diphosphatase